MPWFICPVCGKLGHASIRDEHPAEWVIRASRADGYEPVDSVTAPFRCPMCWMPLKKGHHVKLRVVPETYSEQLKELQEGIVEVPANDAGLIQVNFDGFVAKCKRTDLWFIPGKTE